MKKAGLSALVALLIAAGCGGGGGDNPSPATSTIGVNALFEPYSGKAADSSIGCLQVTLVDELNNPVGVPVVLSRGNTSGQFGPFNNGTPFVLQVRGYHALLPTGQLLAFANIPVIAGATGPLDISANLSTSITSIGLNIAGGIAPLFPGQQVGLVATAYNGNTVVLTSAADTSFVFSVAPPDLGTINPSSNVFTASSSLQQDQSGDISVSFHGQSTSAPITVKANVGDLPKFKVKWGAIEYSRDVAGYVGGIGVVLTQTQTGTSIPAFFARPADPGAVTMEYFIGGLQLTNGHYILQVEGFTGNTDAARGQSLGIATIEFDVPLAAGQELVVSSRLDERIDHLVISANGTDVQPNGVYTTFTGSTVNLGARAVDSGGATLLTDKFIKFTAPAGQSVITLNDALKFFSGASPGTTTLTAKAGIQTGPESTISVTVF